MSPSGAYFRRAVILKDLLPGVIFSSTLLAVNTPGNTFGSVPLYTIWMDWSLHSACCHHLLRSDLCKVFRYLPFSSDTLGPSALLAQRTPGVLDTDSYSYETYCLIVIPDCHYDLRPRMTTNLWTRCHVKVVRCSQHVLEARALVSGPSWASS